MARTARHVIEPASALQAWEARRRRGVRRTVLVVSIVVLAIFLLSLLQGLAKA